jgi:hypothetical protein
MYKVNGESMDKRKGKNWKDKEKLKHKDTVNPDEAGAYILENTPLGGGNISRCHLGEKI